MDGKARKPVNQTSDIPMPPAESRIADCFQSEAGFAERVLASSLNGVYIFDLVVESIVFINAEYSRLTGYDLPSIQRFSGADFFALFHPDDRSNVLNLIERIRRTPDERTWEIECRFKAADGRWIWCLSRNAGYCRHRDGSVRRIVGSFLDISDRKKVEQAVQESERRFRTVFENATDAMVFANTRREMVLFNPAFTAMFGYRPKELAGRTTEFLYAGSEGAEAQGGAGYHSRDAADAGPYEIRCLRRDGSAFWVETSSARIRDNQGNIIGFFGIHRNISGRKQSEADLRKAHEDLEQRVTARTAELETTVKALENEMQERRAAETKLRQWSRVFMDSSDPIVIEDLDGAIIDLNRAAESAYGWSRSELIGKSIRTLLPPERYDAADELRRRCRSGETIRNWEGVRQDQGGRSFPVLVTAFQMTDERGDPVSIATVAKDISTLKQVEAELKSSRLNLQELSRKSIEALESDRRVISRELHDNIGGGLAAIKHRLEAIAAMIPQSPEKAGAALDQAVAQLSESIKDTKTISVNLRPLTLDDLGLLSTIDWYARRFSKRYRHIRLVRKADLREDEIDEPVKIVIYRVLQEALKNVARHSGADTVHIRLKKTDGHLDFEVRDNGCGFDPQRLSPDTNSLNYGLQNMRDRAEICGGSFEVHSVPGRGARIRVLLPVVPGEPDLHPT